jgi:hypothetical protein
MRIFAMDNCVYKIAFSLGLVDGEPSDRGKRECFIAAFDAALETMVERLTTIEIRAGRQSSAECATEGRSSGSPSCRRAPQGTPGGLALLIVGGVAAAIAQEVAAGRAGSQPATFGLKG